jgi:hypothetical protein
METGGERVMLVAFALNALLAGANSVGIRFSNRELDPLWLFAAHDPPPPRNPHRRGEAGQGEWTPR